MTKISVKRLIVANKILTISIFNINSLLMNHCISIGFKSPHRLGLARSTIYFISPRSMAWRPSELPSIFSAYF